MRAGLLALMLVGGLAMAQERPQMDAATAARNQVADYLGDWQPQPLGDARAWKPDFVVALDGSGTHKTLQSALNALPAKDASNRRYYIQMKPGQYREQLCIRDKAAFTLYGRPDDPAAVVIVAGHFAGEPKAVGAAANACLPNAAATTYGTAGSATFGLFSDAAELAHLTVANDAMDAVRAGQGYPPAVAESGGAQAVALMTEGDRIQLESVRLLGHQDTFYARARAQGASRVYVGRSLIAGDVDFIFGNATLVIEASVIQSRAGRRTPGEGGIVLAPSTAPGQARGFLVTGSRLLGDAGLAAGSAALGRAWDAGVPKGQWQAGVSPNGQALIRDSELGPHLGPWSASTSRRPFSASGGQANRLHEFNNRQQIDPARERLAENDGWAAAGLGTSGGSAAMAEHVFEVSNRAELTAALALGGKPKIIKLKARIDLSSDDQGRPLGYEDFRDPAFDFEAYLRDYDPKTWGKKPLEGPQEEARKRSSKRQAERVMLRIPSNTTLIGIAPGAGFFNGGLMLDGVENIIVRHLHLADAYDQFPAWDPKDNANGEWNSDYDTITLRRATRVWIDHCTFDDGARPDQAERIAFGRPMQHHDGLLDITQQSDLVTVSWNVFRQHDKTNLVGSSDSQKLDEGKLRVSFHHNLWEQVMERTPRVRFGQVHVYNNLFVGRDDVAYRYGYSLGVGQDSRLYSQNNVWELPASIPASQIVRVLKGQRFHDSGSLLNGQPVDLLGAVNAGRSEAISGDVGWQPRLHGGIDPADQVAARVRAGAGAGRW
ncbi:pectinesterase family protein [Pelomonas sp. SE-A7]|uniref:pectinesterase family protein n=1 Tax=Pelomonas sp. SE-A7 TaxID=3054953 RepID=UPI00259D0F9A|nr:pectinesterase family protein [Pelomonas sp. SE-A7]MDM4767289.1 pectinesterase family protein [Pelomonas sp. SE-A7]